PRPPCGAPRRGRPTPPRPCAASRPRAACRPPPCAGRPPAPRRSRRRAAAGRRSRPAPRRPCACARRRRLRPPPRPSAARPRRLPRRHAPRPAFRPPLPGRPPRDAGLAPPLPPRRAPPPRPPPPPLRRQARGVDLVAPLLRRGARRLGVRAPLLRRGGGRRRFDLALLRRRRRGLGVLLEPLRRGAFLRRRVEALRRLGGHPLGFLPPAHDVGVLELDRLSPRLRLRAQSLRGGAFVVRLAGGPLHLGEALGQLGAQRGRVGVLLFRCLLPRLGVAQRPLGLGGALLGVDALLLGRGGELLPLERRALRLRVARRDGDRAVVAHRFDPVRRRAREADEHAHDLRLLPAQHLRGELGHRPGVDGGRSV